MGRDYKSHRGAAGIDIGYHVKRSGAYKILNIFFGDAGLLDLRELEKFTELEQNTVVDIRPQFECDLSCHVRLVLQGTEC